MKRYSKKRKRILTFYRPISSFKVPASVMLNEVDHESVQKRVCVTDHEWAVTSSQELPNLAGSGHCLFSSGSQFLSTKTNKRNLVKQCSCQASKIKT